MKKTILFGLILLVLTACAPVQKPTPDNILTPIEKEEVYSVEEAIRTNDRAICYKLTEQADIDRCYAYFLEQDAEAKRIAEEKAKLTEEATQKKVETVKISKIDLSTCERIVTQKEKGICYGRYAAYANDFSVCEALETDYARYHCYTKAAVLTGNTKICNTFTGQEQMDCYTAVALELKDVHVCDVFTSHDKSYCYYLYAFMTNDRKATTCELLTDEALRNACYTLCVDSC